MANNTVKCPECGHLNPKGTFLCQNCESMIDMTVSEREDPATKPIDYGGEGQAVSTVYIDDVLDADEELRTGRAIMNGDLLLIIPELGEKILLKNEQLNEVVIGRRNTATDYMPTVDLTEIEGHKYGVSRRHATLTQRDSLLVLIDHTSKNGTFLNGKRLIPEQPRVVRDNDMIRLGQLEIVISFQKS